MLARKDRNGYRCRECSAKNSARRSRAYAKRFPALGKAATARWERNNVAYKLQYQRAAKKSLREKILDGYGGKCFCCGEGRRRFLALDHIYNDGKADRRKSNQLFRKLINAGFPRERHQLLCTNCNWAKAHGGCPHIEEREYDAKWLGV